MKRTEKQIKEYQKNHVKKSEDPNWIETRGRKPGFGTGGVTKIMDFSINKELVPVLRELAKENKFNMSKFVNAHLKSWVNLQLKKKSK